MLRIASPPTCWRCEPGLSWSTPPLPDYLRWYVMDGAGRLVLRGQCWDLVPGAGIVFAPGDQPWASHDPRRRQLVFGVDFAGASGQPHLCELLTAYPKMMHHQGFRWVPVAWWLDRLRRQHGPT